MICFPRWNQKGKTAPSTYCTPSSTNLSSLNIQKRRGLYSEFAEQKTKPREIICLPKITQQQHTWDLD